MHIGTDDTYIALNGAWKDPAEQWVPYDGKPGLNHLGYEVGDVETLQATMRDAGYRESTVPNDHPHRKRVYFCGPDGNNWEFIQYFSTDPAKRNDNIIGGMAMRLPIFGSVLFALPTTVFAYFDPGTGSLIIQGLIGAIAAITVFWRQLKSYVHSLFSRENNDRSPATPESIIDDRPPVDSED